MSRTFIDIVTNNTTTRKGEKNMSNIIFIHKEAGTKKDAVRVNRESDIPEFLKETIKIVDGKLQLDCVEGIKRPNLEK